MFMGFMMWPLVTKPGSIYYRVFRLNFDETKFYYLKSTHDKNILKTDLSRVLLTIFGIPSLNFI